MNWMLCFKWAVRILLIPVYAIIAIIISPYLLIVGLKNLIDWSLK
jgi:hypothetical protein